MSESALTWQRTIVFTLTMCVLALTVVPPAALAQNAPLCSADVIVRPGDTLSAIAERTLGDSGAFGRIVSATALAAKSDPSYSAIVNPAIIAVGWKLCIPSTGASAALATTNPGNGQAPSATATPTNAEPALSDAPVDDAPVIDGEQLTIDYLAAVETPGSDLLVEQELAVGANYRRFLVSYQSDGLKILALLTIPNGAAPAGGWPAIVFNHGYIPPDVYRTTERYVAYVDGFARNGYVVLKPDYRGHGFSEGEARGAYGFPDYAIDVLNAVASLKRHPQVDANRIGMWGHSMGGYLTLRTMVVSQDVKAGVIWAGVVASYPDLLQRWRRPSGSDIPPRARRWRQQLVDQFGTPEENPEFWASISSNSYLRDLSGPLQLHHGTADESVPYEFSPLLYDQITAVGGNVELYSYKDDNHNLAGQFSVAMKRSVDFFDLHLK